MLFYVLYFFIIFHYLCKHINSDVCFRFIFQRDVFNLFLIHAALRSKERRHYKLAR